MSQVLSFLYLGGKADAKDKAMLQKLNIKYILNCTPPRTVDRDAGCPSYYEKEKSFVYKRIPIFDNKGEDIIAHMTAAYNFIEEGKHYGNVLVHCLKGVSRSASFVIGYLMRKNEFTLEEALAHVQMCRPVVQPNSSFLAQLETFQSTLLLSSEAAHDTKNAASGIAEVSIGPSMARAAVTFAVEEAGPALPSNENHVHIRESDAARVEHPPSPEFVEHRRVFNHSELHPTDSTADGHFAEEHHPHFVDKDVRRVEHPPSPEFAKHRRAFNHSELHPTDSTADGHFAEKHHPRFVDNEVRRVEHPPSQEFLERRKSHYHAEIHPTGAVGDRDLTEEHHPHFQAQDLRRVNHPPSPEFVEHRRAFNHSELHPTDSTADGHFAEEPHPHFAPQDVRRENHTPSQEFLERRKSHYHSEAVQGAVGDGGDEGGGLGTSESSPISTKRAKLQ